MGVDGSTRQALGLRISLVGKRNFFELSSYGKRLTNYRGRWQGLSIPTDGFRPVGAYERSKRPRKKRCVLKMIGMGVPKRSRQKLMRAGRQSRAQGK